MYRDLIAAGVPPMPGARACLERLHGAWPLAVVTNSTRAETAVLLRAADLAALLDAVIAREDYAAAKPAPDAYLAAAAALGLRARGVRRGRGHAAWRARGARRRPARGRGAERPHRGSGLHAATAARRTASTR